MEYAKGVKGEIDQRPRRFYAEVAVVVLVEVGGEAGADDVILEAVFDAGGVEEGGEFGEGGGHEVLKMEDEGWMMADLVDPLIGWPVGRR